jgi:dihydrofolate reductase
MRKLILSMHMSLDGFVEGPNKDMSWMQTDDKEDWDNLFPIIKNVDLFLVGRGMWKGYRDYWTKALTEPGFSDNEVKYAKLAAKTPHIIFSGSLKQTGWSNATIAGGDLKKTIMKLKKQPGKDIQVWGGARFAASLIDSGLIDEYRMLIEPVILAKGKSIFSRLVNRHGLKLDELKKLQNGVIVTRYTQLDTRDTEKVKRGK